jgi:hypothetical protein
VLDTESSVFKYFRIPAFSSMTVRGTFYEGISFDNAEKPPRCAEASSHAIAFTGTSSIFRVLHTTAAAEPQAKGQFRAIPNKAVGQKSSGKARESFGMKGGERNQQIAAPGLCHGLSAQGMTLPLLQPSFRIFQILHLFGRYYLYLQLRGVISLDGADDSPAGPHSPGINSVATRTSLRKFP